MMRGLVIGVMLGVLLVSFNAYPETQNIVYVDLFEVFNKYKKTEDYQNVLEKEQGKKESELEKQKKEIDKLQEEFKLLKDSEKEKKRKALEAKASDFDIQRRQALLDLKKDRDEKMKEILKDIETAIEKYARKNKLTLVIKKAAITYGDKRLDKTQDIIKILNKEYKK